LADARPLAERPIVILILSGLSGLTAISIDIILPATGLIAQSLGAQPEAGALLVGVYLVAYGLGQLFWGMIADAFGRRPALVYSLAGFLVASLLCALATSFWWLVALRALQGLMGGAPVVARAIVRDLGEVAGWRACFWFLLVLGAALIVLSLKVLPETVPHRRPERFSLRFLAHAARTLFPKRAFLGGMLVAGFIFAGYASVLSLGAVVMETRYGLGPTAFALTFAVAALCTVTGSLSVRTLVPRYGMGGVVRMLTIVLGCAVALQLILLLTSPGLLMFWALSCLYFFAFGLSMPVTQAIAMEPAKDMAGFASSILGAGLMAFGGVGAALALALYDGTHTAISGTIVMCGLAALVSCALLRRS